MSETLKNKIKQFSHVSARPMFGYECFSANGKFFVGFSKKNKHEVIVRLSNDEQQKAVKKKGIKPFSHGAKKGWVEINTKQVSSVNTLKLIRKGYEYALLLAKS